MKEKNYETYHFTWKDWLEYLFKLFLKGSVICYLFYNTYKAWILIIPFGVVDYRALKQKKLENQKREITLQFKSMMESIATALSAGYSLERSFEEAKRDLLLIYKATEHIFGELDLIIAGMQMNMPVETLVQGFGKRSGVDDISDFANVITVAKQSGGNLIHIIQKTVNRIADKLAVEEEIETMITAKKYEEKVMMVMPYGILFYLRIANDGFFDVLYGNVLGVVLMTVFLAVIYVADMWAQKIMEIQV